MDVIAGLGDQDRLNQELVEVHGVLEDAIKLARCPLAHYLRRPGRWPGLKTP